MTEMYDLEIQKKILDFISKNPGVHLSKIAEILSIKIPLIEQYLSYMEKTNLIDTIESEGFKKYYTHNIRKGSRDQRTIVTQGKIYTVIAKEPGIHLSRIAEICNMRTSLAEYHLLSMERQQLLTSVKQGGGYYKRYYIEDDSLGTEDKKILGLLRIETSLKIVLFLLKNPSFRHKDLLKNLNIASSTLSYHINKLVDNDIIEVASYGEEKGYSIKNKKKIIRLLRKYEMHQILGDFKDIWKDFNFWE